jgi:hypothetical protein
MLALTLFRGAHTRIAQQSVESSQGNCKPQVETSATSKMVNVSRAGNIKTSRATQNSLETKISIETLRAMAVGRGPGALATNFRSGVRVQATSVLK